MIIAATDPAVQGVLRRQVDETKSARRAEMKTSRWIGTEYEQFAVGQIGFLVHRSHVMRGSDHYDLRDRPATTNQSYEPRLYGWCGTTDDVAVYGCGVARVERVAANGRAYVKSLNGDELASALEDLGYPDLS